ncbi:hypothetical protein C0J52_06489 [Blattella germanica]|nr:hypothetical protein C0J52_06489 [Blattella germanica]
MSSRQKRSSGGYGLRRKIAKKRLDEDFEYYFSKIGTQLDPSAKPGKDQKIHTHLVMVTELVDTSSKSDMKINESPEKRPRGRPKKSLPIHSQDIDFSDPTLKFVELKEKRAKKYKPDYLDEAETTKAVHEICPRNDTLMTVTCEEEVVDSLVKKVKLESILSPDGITGLQEEEVTSLPEGEKENLPEEGIHLEHITDPDECLEVQMEMSIQGDIEDRAIYEVEEDQDKDAGLIKMKRKYKRGRLSQDAIQKLSQLSPDDKIECTKCHKLLKPSSFRQHLRTHTGEKPFGCEVCDARFTRKGDVERHVRIVHNKQKPFKCCRCQRAFGDKKNLRWHLMNHDKKLFYVCEVCGFKFGKREYWENHVRFIHPIPGGLEELDETNVIGEEDEVEGEDRLRTLTKNLLGEDESVVDDPTQDCVAAVKSIQDKEQTIDDPLATEISLPLISQDSKTEGLKIINVKNLNLPNLLKLGQHKMTSNVQPFARVLGQTQGGGIEAVVIQLGNSNSGSSTLQSLPSVSGRYHPTSMIQVVNSDNMLQLIQTEQLRNQSIVIETQEIEENMLNDSETAVIDCPSDMIQEQVVEVEGGMTSGVEVDQYVPEESAGGGAEQDESTKVISIMLNEEVDDANNSSVQTLIEALLVAAKGDDQNNIQTT